jgi:hypothetical protein
MFPKNGRDMVSMNKSLLVLPYQNKVTQQIRFAKKNMVILIVRISIKIKFLVNTASFTRQKPTINQMAHSP